MLAVDGIHLAVHAARREQRGEEELRETVQGALKVGRQDVEEVVGLVKEAHGSTCRRVESPEASESRSFSSFHKDGQYETVKELRQRRDAPTRTRCTR